MTGTCAGCGGPLTDGRDVHERLVRGSRWHIACLPAPPCPDCEGCGQVANSDEREPWTAWTSLPPGSDLAITLGLVAPVTCTTCAGTGRES